MEKSVQEMDNVYPEIAIPLNASQKISVKKTKIVEKGNSVTKLE